MEVKALRENVLLDLYECSEADGVSLFEAMKAGEVDFDELFENEEDIESVYGFMLALDRIELMIEDFKEREGL